MPPTPDPSLDRPLTETDTASALIVRPARVELDIWPARRRWTQTLQLQELRSKTPLDSAIQLNPHDQFAAQHSEWQAVATPNRAVRTFL